MNKKFHSEQCNIKELFKYPQFSLAYAVTLLFPSLETYFLAFQAIQLFEVSEMILNVSRIKFYILRYTSYDRKKGEKKKMGG